MREEDQAFYRTCLLRDYLGMMRGGEELELKAELLNRYYRGVDLTRLTMLDRGALAQATHTLIGAYGSDAYTDAVLLVDNLFRTIARLEGR